MHPTLQRSPHAYARMGGLMYLAIIALGLFGEVVVRQSVVVAGDAAATAANLLASPLLWRTGIAGDLVMHLLDVPVMLILYFLLKPVNPGLALLATLFNIVQTAVLALNKLLLVAPLMLLHDAGPAGSLAAPQAQALSLIAIALHGHGFAIGLMFFGVACLIRGHLLFASGYFPRWLGVLLVLAGVGYLVNSFALLVVPWVADMIFPGILVPAFIGELALSLWLIFKGRGPQRLATAAAMNRQRRHGTAP